MSPFILNPNPIEWTHTWAHIKQFFFFSSYLFLSFSHLSSLFTLPGTIQLFNYYFVHIFFHYAGDICPPKHFCIKTLISLVLTLQILLTIMDNAHCYFTFDHKLHLYKYFFLKKKVKTHFFSSLSFNNNCLEILSSLV